MENRYLRPLFWQHGEKKEILVEEIEQMYQNGVGEFIVESRPHPDYLSYGWWRDLDIIIEAAKQRDMGVWIFDDSSYPSGVAAGKIAKLYPEMTKRYMGEYHIDVMGPRKETTINIGAWVKKNTVVGVENLQIQKKVSCSMSFWQNETMGQKVWMKLPFVILPL